MRFEVDTSKPDELRKLKREMEVGLATIEAALIAIGKNGNDSPAQAVLGLPVAAAPAPPTSSTQEADPPPSPRPELPEPLNQLPSQFSMRDALNLAESGNYSLPSMRRMVLRLMNEGALILVARGKGPKPSIFRKA